MAGLQASSPGEGELARRQDNGSSVSRSRRPRFRETVLESKTVLGLTYVPSIDPSIALIQLKNVCLGSSNRRRVKGRPRFPSTVLGLLPITVSTDHGNRISYRGRFYVHAKPSSVPRSVVDISEYASPTPAPPSLRSPAMTSMASPKPV